MSKKYLFVDNKGRSFELDGSLTLAQLAQMGMRDIKIEPPSTPLPDGWYAHDPTRHEQLPEGASSK